MIFRAQETFGVACEEVASDIRKKLKNVLEKLDSSESKKGAEGSGFFERVCQDAFKGEKIDIYPVKTYRVSDIATGPRSISQEDRFSIVVAKAREWAPLPRKDDFRTPDSHKNGGFALYDDEITHRLRSSGKEMLKTIGKKLLTGKFNLTTISFPIKCMCHLSMLHAVGSLGCVFPYYLNTAALSTDPVERMKHVMTTSIAYIYPTHMFEKPVRNYP